MRRLEEESEGLVTAAPVWNELVFGCRRFAEGARRRALETYLREVIRDRIPILPYDLRAATWHGRERARLEALGRRPAFVDGQIASIAATHDLVLVTANLRDFSAFEGLVVEDWRGGRGGKN